MHAFAVGSQWRTRELEWYANYRARRLTCFISGKETHTYRYAYCPTSADCTTAERNRRVSFCPTRGHYIIIISDTPFVFCTRTREKNRKPPKTLTRSRNRNTVTFYGTVRGPKAVTAQRDLLAPFSALSRTATTAGPRPIQNTRR